MPLVFCLVLVLSKATAPAARRPLTSSGADTSHGLPSHRSPNQSHAKSGRPIATGHSTTNSEMKKAGHMSCVRGPPSELRIDEHDAGTASAQSFWQPLILPLIVAQP